MKAKEQKKERSKSPVQNLGEKDLQIAKAGATRAAMICADCTCLASTECTC